MGQRFRSAPLLLVLALCVPAWAATARPTTWRITSGEEGNLVSFLSKAPLESVEGKTNQASGTVSVDTEALRAGCRVAVLVDLASIDTGIGKRNQHMRENHLETDQFPHATFETDSLASASAETLAPGATVELELVGDFKLHGVTRRIRIPVSVARSEDGQRLAVESHFDVKLADYQIRRPKFLVMKLDEVQHVSVALVAHRAPEGS